MRTLTDAEKRDELAYALSRLPAGAWKDPRAAALLVLDQPTMKRWRVEVPDPLGNHG